MIAWLLLACAGEPATTAPPPPDPCEVAWEELVITRDALAAASPEAIEAPSEQAFRRACEALPEEARPCLAPSVHLARFDACEAALEGVPRDVAKQARRGLRRP